MIHVFKHDMDPNSNMKYLRKIPPMYLLTLGNCDSWQAKQGNVFEILCLVEDVAHTISICTLGAIHKRL